MTSQGEDSEVHLFVASCRMREMFIKGILSIFNTRPYMRKKKHLKSKNAFNAQFYHLEAFFILSRVRFCGWFSGVVDDISSFFLLLLLLLLFALVLFLIVPAAESEILK